MASRADQLGAASGDRVVFLGIGQRRGKHGDLSSPFKGFCTVRFDDGVPMLCLLKDCHPIPRRPRPDF